MHCGQSERDLKIAQECYKKAVLCNPVYGKPFNQLALTYRKTNSWAAFLCFLQALGVQKPFLQALENISSLDSVEFSERHKKIVCHFCSTLVKEFRLFLIIIYRQLVYFLRSSKFENEQKSFDEELNRLIMNEKVVEAIALVYPLSLFSIYTINAECILYTNDF
jgi:hypothetical protein